MGTEKCGCVYADRSNTASVRSAHEMGGYLKMPCPKHARKEPAATVQRYSADDCVSAANWLRFAANACAMVPDDAAETLPFVTDDCPYATAIPGISGDVYDNLMQFADLIAALQARIAELEVRNAASGRDAVRLDWIGANAREIVWLGRPDACRVILGNGWNHERATVREAIDAAIDAHAQGQAGEE